MESARLRSGNTDSPKCSQERGVTVIEVPACPNGGMLSVSKGAVPVSEGHAGNVNNRVVAYPRAPEKSLEPEKTLFLSAAASSSPSHCVIDELTMANCLTAHKRPPLTHFSGPRSFAHHGNLFVNKRVTG